MTAVRPVYPSSIFTWTDRIDQESIDFANDINSVASDLISVETVLGTSPEIESSPPTGLPIAYISVASRITDAMVNNLLPVGELAIAKVSVTNTTSGQLNSYKASYDPYGMFNGTDITIPAPGWWFVTATQQWSGWDDGYDHMSLCLNGISNAVDEQILNWEFPGNNTINGIPGRWQAVGFITAPAPSNLRPVITSVSWQGLAHKGDRFSVLSENGTTNASQSVANLTLKASMLKRISGNFTTG